MNYFKRKIIPLMVLAGLLAMPLFPRAEAMHRYPTRLKGRVPAAQRGPEVGRNVRDTKTEIADYQQDQSQNQPQQISLGEKMWTKKQWLALFFVGLVLGGCAYTGYRVCCSKGKSPSVCEVDSRSADFDVCHEHEQSGGLECYQLHPDAQEDTPGNIVVKSCILPPGQPLVCTHTSLTGVPDRTGSFKELLELVPKDPQTLREEENFFVKGIRGIMGNPEAEFKKAYAEMRALFPVACKGSIPREQYPVPRLIPKPIPQKKRSVCTCYDYDHPDGHSEVLFVGEGDQQTGVAAHELGHWLQWVNAEAFLLNGVRPRLACGVNIERDADLLSVLATRDSNLIRYMLEVAGPFCSYASSYPALNPCTPSVINEARQKIKNGDINFYPARSLVFGPRKGHGHIIETLFGSSFSGEHPDHCNRVGHMLELLLKLPEIRKSLVQQLASGAN